MTLHPLESSEAGTILADRDEFAVVEPGAEIETHMLSAASVLSRHVHIDRHKRPRWSGINVAEMSQHHLKPIRNRCDDSGHERGYSDQGMLALAKIDLDGGRMKLPIRPYLKVLYRCALPVLVL
jgi:hypothetical protein